MFTPTKKIETEVPAEDSTAEGEQANNEQPEEDDQSDIHTMPQKFLDPGAKPKKKGRINWVIMGSIIFLGLGGAITAVILFLGSQTPEIDVGIDPADRINRNINQQVEDPVANQNENTNTNTNVNNIEYDLDSVNGRDLKRLKDITDYRTALLLYFKTYQVFPTSIGSLAEKYFNELPENPQPGGADYTYIATDNQMDYKLTFSLEEESEWGILKLPLGEYMATVEGILPFVEEDKEKKKEDTNINQNENTNSESQFPPKINEPSLGLDSDGDQLSDIEENIFKTNSALADTDGDGFTDASEILNFFDPTTRDRRLMDSDLINVYQNPSYFYSLLYPKAWSVKSLPTMANNSGVIFTYPTGEYVEILVKENTSNLTASQWYLRNNSGTDMTQFINLTIDGFPAIQTPDGLVTYLALGPNVYILSYNISTQQQMNFNITYQLFLKSFIFIEAEE